MAWSFYVALLQLSSSIDLHYTVIEWLNGTSFEGPGQTESYQFAVGYTKGANTLRAVNQVFTIRATPVGSTGKTICNQ